MPKTIKNSPGGQADQLPGISSSSHHDRIFKRFFCLKKFAIELAQLILTKEELQSVILSKLKVEKNLFKGKRMDLVLSIPLKGLPENIIRIVILCEHKSRLEKGLFKQALGYQTTLYEESKHIIATIPTLFYHGKAPLRSFGQGSSRGKWQLSFQEAILGEFFPKIPRSILGDMLNFRLRPVDTGDKRVQRVFKDQRFKIGPVLRLMDRIWALKDNEQELRDILFDFFKVFSAEKWILAVAQYLKAAGIKLKTWNKLEKEAIKKGLLTKGGYMDIREEIRLEGKLEGMQKGIQQGMQKGIQQGIQQGMQQGRQEGRQEGIQQGMQKGQQSLIRKMLQKGSVAQVAKLTGLTEKNIKKLQNGD